MTELIWPWVAIGFSVAALVVARSEVALQRLNTLAWLTLGGGFAWLLFAEQTPLAAAVGVAALAAIVPVAVAAVALVCVRDATTQWPGQLVVYTAAWAALVAGMTNLVVAAGLVRRPLSISVPIAGVGVAAGIAIAGTGRSSLPEAFYGFPLRAGAEPLMWEVGPVPGFMSGIRLAVAAPVPSFWYVILGIGALFGLAGAAVALGKRKPASTLLGVVAVSAVGALASLTSVVSRLSMPGEDAYADEVKRRLLARGQERVIDTGTFSSGEEITVAMADLAPEIFGFVVAASLALVATIALLKDAPKPDPEEELVSLGLGRDAFLRAVTFLWLAWFVTMTEHSNLIGAPGMGSPAEWAFVGTLLITTGLLFAGWKHRDDVLGQRLLQLGPGVAFALWCILAGLSWRFGALPGFSLGVL